MMSVEKPTNLQLELLQAFQYDLPDIQLVEIKELLIDHLMRSGIDVRDRSTGEQNGIAEQMTRWANGYILKK